MASLFTEARKTEMYQFFAVAFNAAPGVTFFTQLQQAVEAGLTTQQIVNEFTTKGEFLNRYPTFLSSQAFATSLVNNVARSSITDAAKANAVNDIVMALDAGLSRSQVIFNVFTNIAATTDQANQYFGVAQQLRNEVNVARYYTEVQLSNSQDPAVLRQVLANVTNTTDTSSNAAIQTFLNNNGSGVAGQTITLTAGADARTGGAGPDIFTVLTDAHLAAFDTIDGGASNDTLLFTDNIVANAPTAGAVVDAMFQNVKSVEVVQASYSAVGSSVSLAANAAAAGVNTVNLQGAAKAVDLRGFTSAITVNGTDQIETVSIDLANAGNRTLNLGAGQDIVNTTVAAAATAGSVQINFTSAAVGNGTNNNVTLVGPNGTTTVNDEGVTLNSTVANAFNVVGLAADGTVDLVNQNRGNFTTAILGTSAADTFMAAAGANNVYINSGGGNDMLTSATQAGQRNFLVGGAGDDQLTISGPGTNVVIAGGGNDQAFVDFGTGNGLVNVALTSGTNTITFANGTLTGGLASTADTVTGGTDATDTLRATVADASGYITPVARTISGFETLGITNALTGTVTVANLQQGITTVNLEAGGTGTIANEAGARTVNIGSATATILGGNTIAGGVLTGALTVTAAGTAIGDSLTLVNTNRTAANVAPTNANNNAFAGHAVVATGYESVAINTGAVATVAQTIGAVQIRAAALGAVPASAANNNDALTFNLTGANAVTVDSVEGNTNGTLTINASGLTAQATGATFTLTNGGVANDAAMVVVGPPAFPAFAAGKVSIVGSEGNDILGLSGLSANSVSAGGGNDSVTSGALADSIDGGAGNDTLIGAAGADTLVGGLGNDIINGGADADNLQGGDGDDTYVFVTGDVVMNETVTFGAGNDTFRVDTSTDFTLLNGGTTALTGLGVIALAANNNTATFNAAQVNGLTASVTGIAVGANVETLVVNGTANSDLIDLSGFTLDANSQTSISGLAGSDIIVGSKGADIIVGGIGADQLSGGTGSDSFVYKQELTGNPAALSGAGAATAVLIGGDTITGFEGAGAVGGDVVTVSKAAFGLASNIAAGFSTAADFASVANDAAVEGSAALIVFSQATGSVFYNASNAAGNATLLATLTGINNLAADDFAVIA